MCFFSTFFSNRLNIIIFNYYLVTYMSGFAYKEGGSSEKRAYSSEGCSPNLLETSAGSFINETAGRFVVIGGKAVSLKEAENIKPGILRAIELSNSLHSYASIFCKGYASLAEWTPENLLKLMETKGENALRDYFVSARVQMDRYSQGLGSVGVDEDVSQRKSYDKVKSTARKIKSKLLRLASAGFAFSLLVSPIVCAADIMDSSYQKNTDKVSHLGSPTKAVKELSLSEKGLSGIINSFENNGYLIWYNVTVTTYQNLVENLYDGPKAEVFNMDNKSLGFYKEDFLEQVRVDGSGIGDGKDNPGTYLVFDFNKDGKQTYHLADRPVGAYGKEIRSLLGPHPTVGTNPEVPEGTEIVILDLGPDKRHNPNWLNLNLEKDKFIVEDKFFGFPENVKKLNVYVGHQQSSGFDGPETFLMRNATVAVKYPLGYSPKK